MVWLFQTACVWHVHEGQILRQKADVILTVTKRTWGVLVNN